MRNEQRPHAIDGVSKMGIAFSYFELLYDSVEICAQILGSRYLGI